MRTLGEELLCERSLLAKFKFLRDGNSTVAPDIAFTAVTADGEPDPCQLLDADKGNYVLEHAAEFISFYHALMSHERELQRQRRVHDHLDGINVEWLLAVSKCIYVNLKATVFPDWSSDHWNGDDGANFATCSRNEVLATLPSPEVASATQPGDGREFSCATALKHWVEGLPRELCTCLSVQRSPSTSGSSRHELVVVPLRCSPP